MFAFWVVEEFDVDEDVAPGIFSGFVGSAPDAFALQQVEKALDNKVVMAVTAAAHTVFQIVMF